MDGRLVERQKLSTLGDETVSQLRTAVDSQNRRWFALGGPGRQRVHLFDDAWKHKWSFPDHEHPGIGDAVLAPLGEEGALQLVVGFWGDLGVHAVSLSGERQWVDRSLQEVLALTLAVDEKQRPAVWTLHGREILGRVGAAGPLPPLTVEGRAMIDAASADLNGDGQEEACGIAFVDLGVYDAVGFDAAGRERWSYRLPSGEFRTPTTRIVPSGTNVAGWFLPAADGSIHLLSADGKLLDRFHHGQPIAGIDVAGHNGQTLVVLASPTGVSAWTLRRPE
jgi:hypothetical protein